MPHPCRGAALTFLALFKFFIGFSGIYITIYTLYKVASIRRQSLDGLNRHLSSIGNPQKFGTDPSILVDWTLHIKFCMWTCKSMSIDWWAIAGFHNWHSSAGAPNSSDLEKHEIQCGHWTCFLFPSRHRRYRFTSVNWVWMHFNTLGRYLLYWNK